MAKPVFNWASVAKGKPQLTADVEHAKEKERLAKAEQERLAWEAAAPMRARQDSSVNAIRKKEQEQALARHK